MRILILGGTVFLGRHLVTAARERGHEVILFNRGRSNPFPDLETIVGDRDPNNGDGLSKLKGREFDAVMDTSGYVPRIVKASAQALEAHTKHYTFISSISVYSETSQPGMDESGPLATLEDPNTEDIAPHYGGLKAACENVVSDVYGARALNIRPGLIVGPYDPTDRFTYWPVRVAKGGQILAPNNPQMWTQFIDARDLAEWNVRLVEQQVAGVFNATGYPTHMGAVLEACGGGNITWADEAFLEAQKVAPWMGENSLPLWVPNEEGFMQLSIDRALQHGLTFRPLEVIAKDTLEWANSRPADYAWRSGLSAAREQELLTALG